jgi:type IX secretion system PorP/SprF family membrane protein
MSKPSFSNIELWLFELSEGNLNPQQVEELRIFLLKHPELDVEKDVWEMARIQPVAQSAFPNTAALEKKEPKRIYYAIGSVAAMLLLFVGCYQFYGDLQTQTQLASSEQQGALVQDLNNKRIQPGISSGATGNRTNRSTSIGGDSHMQSGSDFLRSEAVQEMISQTFSPTSLFMKEESIGMRNALLAMNEVKVVSSAVQNLRRKEFEKLNTYPAEPIAEEKYSSPRRIEKKSLNLPATSSSSEYTETFRMKFNKAMKSLERMFDNPIALKNYRDPHYHVPGKMASEINFSATGTMLRTKVQTLSRMQWYGEENELLMNTASVDGYVYGMRGGLGMQIKNSIYNGGGLSAYEAAFTYSPKLSLNHYISVEPSVRFKMGMKSLNKNRMQDANAIEMDRGNIIAYETPQGSNLWYRDLGLGLMVNTKWFFAGAQVDNLFGHKDNMYGGSIVDPRRAGKEFIATAGVDWESRKENMTLSPYVVYMNKEHMSDVWFGANYRLNWLTIGAAISDKVEPAASLGLKFDRFSLVYNADYLKSALTGKQLLSHQLSVRIMSKPNRYGRKLLNL